MSTIQAYGRGPRLRRKQNVFDDFLFGIVDIEALFGESAHRSIDHLVEVSRESIQRASSPRVHPQAR